MKKISSKILAGFTAGFLFFMTGLNGTTGLYAQELPEETLEQEQDDAPDPKQQRVVKVIVTPHEYDLNPHTACYTSEMQILNGLYEGLFEYNPVTMDPENALCSSYTVSRDKKRWTFTIVKGARFSDGKEITAQTFKDSWIRLFKNPQASFASLLDCIEGACELRNGTGSEKDVKIDAKDKYTLVVTLKQPVEHLPKILCHHAFSAVSTKDNVYSGPYVLSEKTDTTIRLEKNRKYRDAAHVYTPGFEFEQSDNLEENCYRFNNGQCDWIVNEAIYKKIYNEEAVKIFAEFGTSFLFFKPSNAPWNDPDMRNALLCAVPWEQLRNDYLVKAKTLVYPLNGYPSVTPVNEYDLDYAKELLAKAKKKLNIADSEKLTLTYAIPDSPVSKEQYEILHEAWEKLGVELKVQTTPVGRYNSSIQSWNADLFTYTWIGDFADPVSFLELFRSDSALNESGYKNEKYDALLTQAAFADTTEEHYKLLAQAEQLLLNEGMVLPVSHPVSLNFINLQTTGGWSPNALDIHPLKYIYLRKAKENIPNVI